MEMRRGKRKPCPRRMSKAELLDDGMDRQLGAHRAQHNRAGIARVVAENERKSRAIFSAPSASVAELIRLPSYFAQRTAVCVSSSSIDWSLMYPFSRSSRCSQMSR